MKTACVIGLGYIGLPTALLAAQHGCTIIGFDVDNERVDMINAGIAPAQETELQHHLTQALSLEQFKATTTIQTAGYFIIAVPTPCTQEKKADLSAVWQAVDSIISVLQRHNTIILESTVPVGTTEKIGLYIKEKIGWQPGEDFFVAHCPERVLPSNIFHELRYNARLIGGINAESTKRAQEFYAYFVKAELHETNDKTAELVKLIENSYRDVNIAFAHQVGAIADTLSLDPYDVIQLANRHPRVNILQPRCGVGGHCIAIDPWFLIETFPEQTQLLSCARTINDERPLTIIQRIHDIAQSVAKQYNRSCKTLLLGLTYKPDVDDIRESPALHIANACTPLPDMELMVTDPFITKEQLHQYKLHATSLIDGLFWADCVIVLVGHTFFKHQREIIMTHACVIDFCGFLAGHKESLIAQKRSDYAYASSTP